MNTLCLLPQQRYNEMKFRSPYAPSCRKRLSERVRTDLKLEFHESAKEAKKLDFTVLRYPSSTALIGYIRLSEATIT
jgi:hypothetical protein